MKKKGNKRMPTPKQKLIHSPSIHLCLFVCVNILLVKKLSIVPAVSSSNNRHRSGKKCRDGVMNEFLFWCRHPLVPFLFHGVTSLHPPSFQRNDFSTCSTHYFFKKNPIKMRCEDIAN